MSVYIPGPNFEWILDEAGEEVEDCLVKDINMEKLKDLISDL